MSTSTTAAAPASSSAQPREVSWAALPSDVLLSVVRMGKLGGSERHSMVKSLRLVNKHWCKWVTTTVTRLQPHNLEREDLDSFLEKMKTKFVNVTRLEMPVVWTDDDCCSALVHHLPKLNDLEIFWGDCVTDEGLRQLARLPLKSLKLYHSRQITDEGVKALVGSNLEVLWLYGAIEVTDEGLGILGNLTSLQAIKLMYCNRLTRRGLQPLLQKEGLQIVVRFCRRISSEVMIS